MVKKRRQILDFLFRKTAYELSSLLVDKDKKYGDAYTKVEQIMEIIYPNGIPIGHYKYALTLVRMLDKVCRVANKVNIDDDDEDPMRDIAGYALKFLANRDYEKLKDNDFEELVMDKSLMDKSTIEEIEESIKRGIKNKREAENQILRGGSIIWSESNNISDD